jgi:hypothetical protein
MLTFSKWSVSWKRTAIALAMALGVLFLLEAWFLPFYGARLLKSTESDVMPEPLPDSNIAAEPTSRVERQGVSFAVPWVETHHSKTTEETGEVFFENGNGIFISRPSSALGAVRSLRGPGAAALRFELGGAALNSDFSLSSAAVATGVNDARWWHTPFYNNKVKYLLTLKFGLTEFPEDHRLIPIYQIIGGGVRGFQVGDPVQDRVIKLILFDGAGHECRIELLKFKSNISQSEINTVIESLRFQT